MGSKGFKIAAIAVVLLASYVLSGLGADQELDPPINGTNFSADSYPLKNPSDLNLSLFESPLIADIEQLETTDVWEKYNLVSIAICSEMMTQFESQLRGRGLSLDAFEGKLEKKWSHLSHQERIDLTFKLESTLRKQAEYLDEFQAGLKKIWCFLPRSEKKKFLDSFEDLLKRESRLLLKFEDFLHKQHLLPENRKILFLQSFEDLIRRQATLLETFEDFLKVNCDVLELTKMASACCPAPGDTVNYIYNITNKADHPIKNVAVMDSRLGIVAKGLTLGPHETIFVNGSTVLEGKCSDVICNIAMVLGEDTKGFVVHNESKEVCVELVCPLVKENRIKVGLQRSMAVGSDRTKAQNVVKIVGDQRSKCQGCPSYNSSRKIETGDRSSAAFSR
jgi:uncharacterized repeat protein (TIGR01451 family)